MQKRTSASSSKFCPILPRPHISLSTPKVRLISPLYPTQMKPTSSSPPNGVQSSSSAVVKPAPFNKATTNKIITCRCSRTQCLKLYCECFSQDRFCSPHCSCVNCCNTTTHQTKRLSQAKTILQRNPLAFQSKIKLGNSSKDAVSHLVGCKCKRSRCSKNYCECYEANVPCTGRCLCRSCVNTTANAAQRAAQSAQESISMVSKVAETSPASSVAIVRTRILPPPASVALRSPSRTVRVVNASLGCLYSKSVPVDISCQPSTSPSVTDELSQMRPTMDTPPKNFAHLLISVKQEPKCVDESDLTFKDECTFSENRREMNTSQSHTNSSHFIGKSELKRQATTANNHFESPHVPCESNNERAELSDLAEAVIHQSQRLSGLQDALNATPPSQASTLKTLIVKRSPSLLTDVLSRVPSHAFSSPSSSTFAKSSAPARCNILKTNLRLRLCDSQRAYRRLWNSHVILRHRHAALLAHYAQLRRGRQTFGNSMKHRHTS